MRFVFQLCKDLGIDDPVAWFNAVPSRVVDDWLAYYIVVQDESGSPEANMKDPNDVLATLNTMYQQ